MSKYIDLAPEFAKEHNIDKGVAGYVLRCLDEYAAEHPDQVPGRTMKKSDYQELMDGTSLSYGVGFTDGFHMAGGSIAPDPEPTDVEKITRLILENSTDMDPKFIAEMLVENGVRPVKAGGDDDQ